MSGKVPDIVHIVNKPRLKGDSNAVPESIQEVDVSPVPFRHFVVQVIMSKSSSGNQERGESSYEAFTKFKSASKRNLSFMLQYFMSHLTQKLEIIFRLV